MEKRHRHRQTHSGICRALFHVVEHRFWTLCALSVLVPVLCDAPVLCCPFLPRDAFRRCHGGDSTQSPDLGTSYILLLVASPTHHPPKAQCRNRGGRCHGPIPYPGLRAKVPGVLARGLVRPLYAVSGESSQQCICTDRGF